jgi:plastocyanin
MKKVAALLALALAALALVACGDDEGTTTTNAEPSGQAGAESGEKAGGGNEEAGGNEGGGGTATVQFETPSGGQLAYTASEASTGAGKVTIEFNNVQPIPHDVSIEDSSGKTIGQTETITESSTSTTVNLKAGEYTFYCSVPGHREAGMEGTLTVK